MSYEFYRYRVLIVRFKSSVCKNIFSGRRGWIFRSSPDDEIVKSIEFEIIITRIKAFRELESGKDLEILKGNRVDSISIV